MHELRYLDQLENESMTELTMDMRVGQLVADEPARSRVFENYGIDYCCAGGRTVADACSKTGVDPEQLLAELQSIGGESMNDEINPANLTMTELVEHIENTHHAFLRRELPRLIKLMDKVLAVHGRVHLWLAEAQATFLGLCEGMDQHMFKEESILFPMIRQLDMVDGDTNFHCGSINNPIRVMEHEHDNVGKALSLLRTLTNGFVPPDGACNSFRALLDGLATVESDTHQHIHKENNILFVAAAEAAER